MTTMTPRELPLPENCRVRLVDLPVQAGGMISVDEDGFINIYLNARLSREAQRDALQHELRHHYRGDLYSDRDIRAIEREADGPVLRDIDGAPLKVPATAFDPALLRPAGRGIYRPVGANRKRAEAHIDALRGLLLEACRVYDVMQRPPLVPVETMAALAGALGAGDIAFVAWQDCRAVLHFSRNGLYGAIYYGDDGSPDNALAVLRMGEARVTVDIRRINGRPDVCAITREIGDSLERVY